MNEQGVRPALTPEEWKDLHYHRSGDPVWVQGPEVRIGREDYFTPCDDGEEYPMGAVYALSGDHARAVGALLLSVAGPDGGPLLTREHLEALRDATVSWEDVVDNFGVRKGIDAEMDRREERKRAMMREALDLLKSLMPPEDEP